MSTPKIYVMHDDRQAGPFTQEQIADQLKYGAVTEETPAWREGMSDWLPLGQVLASVVQPRPAPPAKAPVKSPATPVRSTYEDHTRKEYLNHEASVRSIGLLYFLGSMAMVLVGTGMLLLPGRLSFPVNIVVALVCFLFAAIDIWVGKGLRNLDRKVRGVSILFAALGLLAIPVGTLINAYILYLLCSAKGEYVFSRRYRAVVKATPHIKCETSRIVLFLVILLALIIVLGVVGLLLNAGKH